MLPFANTFIFLSTRLIQRMKNNHIGSRTFFQQQKKSAEETLDELEVAIRQKNEAKAKQAAAELEPKVNALTSSMENASIAALASEFSGKFHPSQERLRN